eukprot:302885-Prymnesium_polylepis.1
MRRPTLWGVPAAGASGRSASGARERVQSRRSSPANSRSSPRYACRKTYEGSKRAQRWRSGSQKPTCRPDEDAWISPDVLHVGTRAPVELRQPRARWTAVVCAFAVPRDTLDPVSRARETVRAEKGKGYAVNRRCSLRE